MNTDPITDDELKKLVNSYLGKTVPFHGLDWLPLAEIASESPERWVTTFNNLRDKQQFDLIN